MIEEKMDDPEWERKGAEFRRVKRVLPRPDNDFRTLPIRAESG